MKKKCSSPECSRNAQQGGVCYRHGAKRSKCSHPECLNVVKKGGVCWTHGAKEMSAKRTKKECVHPECSSTAYKGGLCWFHGANMKKRCNVPECSKIAQNSGVCWRHGANGKSHSHIECSNFTYQDSWLHCGNESSSSRPECKEEARQQGLDWPHSLSTRKCLRQESSEASTVSVDDFSLLLFLRLGDMACVAASTGSKDTVEAKEINNNC